MKGQTKGQQQYQDGPLPLHRFLSDREVVMAGFYQQFTTAVTRIQATGESGKSGKTQPIWYPCIFCRRAVPPGSLHPASVIQARMLHFSCHHRETQSGTAFVQWLRRHQTWPLVCVDPALLTASSPICSLGTLLCMTRRARRQSLTAPLVLNHLDEPAGAELRTGQSVADGALSDRPAAYCRCPPDSGLSPLYDQAGVYIDKVQCTVQRSPLCNQQLPPCLDVRVQHPAAFAISRSLAFRQVEQASTFLNPELISAVHLSLASSRVAVCEWVVCDTFEGQETPGGAAHRHL